MNAYCTYFDQGFLIQGLALWRSLAAHDPEAVLWVLALDEAAAGTLRALPEPRLRVVELSELEAGDTELLAAKANRTRVEYYFTLSPCWPRWLLARNPDLPRITYLDADLLFFSSPQPIFAAMDAADASVLITSHRLPDWLGHYDRHGRYNVGVLSFRNDAAGRRCLDDWRTRCLAWCYDRLESDRYADQKYLEGWPALLGPALLVLDHPGVNLAPWNWARHTLEVDGSVKIDGEPLVVFHFARFRPTRGDRVWQSGQVDYGIMPQRWRDALYTPYWRALRGARQELRTLRPGFDFPRRPARLNREFWRALPLRVLFGGAWVRLGDRFFNLRLGAGRWSGRALAAARRMIRGAVNEERGSA